MISPSRCGQRPESSTTLAAWPELPAGGTAYNSLSGVSADSATDAWAVGHSGQQVMGQPEETIVLHWNGTSWSKVVSPNPGGTTSSSQSVVCGVSARSASDAWAVGNYRNQ